MKKFILLFTLWLSMQFAFAQQGNTSLEGQVKDERGNPLPFASVSIEGTSKGTISDARGKFKLTNLLPGQYTLIISSIGYKAYQQKITAGEAKAEVIDFTLQTSNELLNEVIVTSRKASETKDRLPNSI